MPAPASRRFAHEVCLANETATTVVTRRTRVGMVAAWWKSGRAHSLSELVARWLDSSLMG